MNDCVALIQAVINYDKWAIEKIEPRTIARGMRAHKMNKMKYKVAGDGDPNQHSGAQ